MIDLIFYLFATLMVFAASMVITLKNPVHAVLFLIFTFFNAAALFIFLGAEFIAMTLVIVYVGAVAVLFLFVIMMLNVTTATIKQGFYRYLPLGLGLGLLIFVEIFLSLKWSMGNMPDPKGSFPEGFHNTQLIGFKLYTEYFYVFQASGIILLIAMIGAIVLTLTHAKDVKRQSIEKQILRKKEDCVEVVKVKFGEGVKL